MIILAKDFQLFYPDHAREIEEEKKQPNPLVRGYSPNSIESSSLSEEDRARIKSPSGQRISVSYR